MPRVSLPELHEGRDGKTQLFKLVNQIKRRFNIVGQLGSGINSATTLVPTGEGDYYHVAGSVTIDYIDVSLLNNGDPLEFYFDNGLTLGHGAVSPPESTYPLQLVGGINAVMAAGSKIRFRADGTLGVMVEMWRGAP